MQTRSRVNKNVQRKVLEKVQLRILSEKSEVVNHIRVLLLKLLSMYIVHVSPGEIPVELGL